MGRTDSLSFFSWQKRNDSTERRRDHRSDYRGELKVLATWIGQGDSFTVGKGERIAQMLFAPVPLVKIEEVTMSELDSTERGVGGFGSSGQY